MRCPNCHSEIDDDSIFCSNCGKVLAATCPKCGKKNASNSKFCKFCGEPLEEKNEPQKQENKQINKEEKRKKILSVFSILSMSGILSTILLLFGLSFAPFLDDSFFPDSIFTIIGYVANSLEPGFKAIIESHNYLPLVNSFILLNLLTAITVLTIVFLAIDTPKLIKSIKKNEYCDFSKHAIIVFILFITEFIYFKGFAYSENLFCQTVNGWIIFGIIFAIVFIVFNIFFKEFSESKHDLPSIIARSCYRILSFIFIMFIAASMGGAKHLASIGSYQDGIYTVSSNVQINNLGWLFILIRNIDEIVENYQGTYIMCFIYTGIPLLLELATLALSGSLLKNNLSNDVNKGGKTILELVTSALFVLFSVAAMILNKALETSLNVFQQATTYGIKINDLFNNSLSIVFIVFSSLLLLNSIASLVLEKIFKGKEIKA